MELRTTQKQNHNHGRYVEFLLHTPLRLIGRMPVASGFEGTEPVFLLTVSSTLATTPTTIGEPLRCLSSPPRVYRFPLPSFPCPSLSPTSRSGFFLWANEVEDKLGRPWNPKGAGAAVTSSWNANQKKKNGSRLTEHSDGDSDDDSDVDLFKNGSGQSQQKKKNKRLLDSPSASRTSDLALVKKRKGNSDRARSPSPDWPDPEELQQEVERLKRENSALKRQIKDAGERESRRDEEVRDLKKENDAFLKQLYPELFRCVLFLCSPFFSFPSPSSTTSCIPLDHPFPFLSVDTDTCDVPPQSRSVKWSSLRSSERNRQEE